MALREFQSRGGILNHVPESAIDFQRKAKSISIKAGIGLLFLGTLSGVYVNLHKSLMESRLHQCRKDPICSAELRVTNHQAWMRK